MIKTYKKIINLHYKMIEKILKNTHSNIEDVIINVTIYTYIILTKLFYNLYTDQISFKKIKNQYYNNNIKYINIIFDNFILYEKNNIDMDITNITHINIYNFFNYFCNYNDYKTILNNNLINKKINIHEYVKLLKNLLYKEFTKNFVKNKRIDFNNSIDESTFKIIKDYRLYNINELDDIGYVKFYIYNILK